MAKELAEKAKEAFLDDDFDVAVDLYSKAIDLDPNCAAFFADRAQANIKIDNFTGINITLFLTVNIIVKDWNFIRCIASLTLLEFWVLFFCRYFNSICW